MKRVVSLVAAVILWAAFLYTALVTATHFLPHFLSWELDPKLVLFLLLDLVLLQLLAWLYEKLPHKPKNLMFAWMEKVSLF